MMRPYKVVLVEEPTRVQMLRARIAEMMRASDDTASYFVEPQEGVLLQMLSRRHHFVFGRRGSGKSSLLLKAQAELRRAGRAVAFVDLSKYAHEDLPHLLLETMKVILQDARRCLSGASKPPRDLLKRIDSQLDGIEKLFLEPMFSQATDRFSSGSSVEGEAGASFSLSLPGTSANLKGKAGESKGVERTRQYDERKVDRVVRELRVFEQTLADVAKLTAGFYVFLDDFYYVAPEDQPQLLQYLQSVCTGRNVWLKAGAVKHRTRTYMAAPNGRPIGLDLTNDASEINLDSSFEHYAVTKAFLEKLLHTAINPCGIAENDLLSPTALTRMIQASGGVARDFLTVLDRSIENATERMLRERQSPDWQSPDYRAANQRIVAEDIWAASAKLNENKKGALRQDAGPNAGLVFENLRTVTDFATSDDRCNVLLIEGPDRFWESGPLLKLWEFKLLHVVYRSKRLRTLDYTMIMLDVGELAHTKANWGRAVDLLTDKGTARAQRPTQTFPLTD